MSVIRSSINPRSAEFQANAAALRKIFELNAKKVMKI